MANDGEGPRPFQVRGPSSFAAWPSSGFANQASIIVSAINGRLRKSSIHIFLSHIFLSGILPTGKFRTGKCESIMSQIIRPGRNDDQSRESEFDAERELHHARRALDAREFAEVRRRLAVQIRVNAEPAVT